MKPQVAPWVPNRRGLPGSECLFLSNCALEDDWTAASRRFGPIYPFPGPKSSYRSRNGDWRQTGSCRPRAISALRKTNKKEHPHLRWEDALFLPVSVCILTEKPLGTKIGGISEPLGVFSTNLKIKTLRPCASFPGSGRVWHESLTALRYKSSPGMKNPPTKSQKS